MVMAVEMCVCHPRQGHCACAEFGGTAFNKSKQLQINQLSSLQERTNSEKEKDRDGIYLAGTQMKRWVKVLSK